MVPRDLWLAYACTPVAADAGYSAPAELVRSLRRRRGAEFGKTMRERVRRPGGPARLGPGMAHAVRPVGEGTANECHSRPGTSPGPR
jgi:hypothetical protein